MATLDRRKMLKKDRLEKVFKTFDKDGTGNIDAGEIKAIFC